MPASDSPSTSSPLTCDLLVVGSGAGGFSTAVTAARLGLDNTPPPAALAHLRQTAQMLERVRQHLGGVPITQLKIQDGASKGTVTFDTPNPVRMSTFSYKTGASSINLTGLGNANFEDMIFEGGTGNYELDFSGALQDDANVRITAGLSNMRITVPAGTPCKVTVTGGLSNISPRGTWTISNNVYEQTGTGPLLTINIEMGLGNLDLISE